MTNSYAYENDRLKTITVNGGLRYAFEYDAFGRTTNTKVGNGTNWRTLSSLEYNNKGLLGKQTYGNDGSLAQTIDFSTGTRAKLFKDCWSCFNNSFRV